MSSDTTVCTPEEVSLSGIDGVYCLSRTESVGLTVVTITGFLSLAAVSVMFALIIRNVIRHAHHAHQTQSGWKLVRSPMDLFLMSLFTADFFQALAVTMGVKWINEGTVRSSSSVCTAQGVLLNLGEAGIAITTLIITLYTFALISWNPPPPPIDQGRDLKRDASLLFAWIIMGVGWSFLILFIAISAGTLHQFYVPTPYWCWISHAYPEAYRTAGENSWLWLAFGVSLLYIPLAFFAYGYITKPTNNNWWIYHIHWKRQAIDPMQSSIAITMVICALAYCIPVLPTSLDRWFLITHGDDKPAGIPVAQFSFKAIFSLSGATDVLVFYIARDRRLLLFNSPESTDGIAPDGVGRADGQGPEVVEMADRPAPPPMNEMADGQAPQPNVTPLNDI